MKNFLFLLVFSLFLIKNNADSQIQVRGNQYRDCFACNPDGTKNNLGCNIGVQFVNQDKTNAYYIRLSEIKYLDGDPCATYFETATKQVKLRPNDGQAPGSTYNHQIGADPWKAGCCAKCDGSIKKTRLSMPVYKDNNTDKVGDLIFEIRTCCGKEPFCGTTSVATLKNYELRLEILPNPITNDIINLNTTLPIGGNLEITVIDILGNIIKSFKMEGNEGMNTFKLHKNGLSLGTYLLLMKLEGVDGKEYYDYISFIKN